MTTIAEISVLLRNGKSVRQFADAGGLPITRIETIADKTINPAKVGFADLTELNSGDWLLQDGDILISHINSTKHLGKCAIYEGDPPALIHGMNLLALRVDQDAAASRYVYRMLSSPGFRRQLPRITKHSVNQSSFTISNFKKLQIPLPILAEQQRIAAILDATDALQAKRRESLAQLDTLLQSTFIEMFGDPVTNPMGWDAPTLGEVVKDASGGNIRTLQSEFLEEGDVPVIDQGQKLVAGFVNDRSRVCRAQPPVIVFGDHTRAIKYVDFEFAMGADGTKVLVPKIEIEAKYLYYALKVIEIPSAGYSRHYKFLKKARIPLPSLNLQSRFASIVESVEQQKASQRAHLDELDTLFASLQSRAFCGDL